MVTSESFKRPTTLDDTTNPAVLYARSYLLTRTAVGVIGLALPVLLIAIEAWAIEGDVAVRGSISAYYHTGARDLFVGALSVVGVLLITYMSAQSDTWDFRLSLLSGVAVLGVAFVPTTRPDLTDAAARCGELPIPPGCTAIPQRIGETLAATVHYLSAGVFIVSLAVLCFLFAHREVVHEGNDRLARTLRACGWSIVGAIGWILLGLVFDATIWQLTPLYVGEVVSVWAFGLAWLLKGRALWSNLPKRLGMVARRVEDAASD